MGFKGSTGNVWHKVNVQFMLWGQSSVPVKYDIGSTRSQCKTSKSFESLDHLFLCSARTKKISGKTRHISQSVLTAHRDSHWNEKYLRALFSLQFHFICQGRFT